MKWGNTLCNVHHSAQIENGCEKNMVMGVSPQRNHVVLTTTTPLSSFSGQTMQLIGMQRIEILIPSYDTLPKKLSGDLRL